MQEMAHSMTKKHCRHCSYTEDCKNEMRLLFQRLLNVGQNSTKPHALFKEASIKLQKKLKKMAASQLTQIKNINFNQIKVSSSTLHTTLKRHIGNTRKIHAKALAAQRCEIA